METETRRLLTIVTEAALEADLTEAIRKLGAMGYTITDARGRGSRGVRDAGWVTSSNIRIEVICEAETANAIAEYLRDNYYRDYAMVLYLTDVSVLRPEKF
ncbi:MAG: transcriptional regulator [Woeseiaceae bacterium]|nr:transcriptional regulator [Woeseiaceae bacterium]